MDGIKVYDENVNVVLFIVGKFMWWNIVRIWCMWRGGIVVYCKNYKNILISNLYLCFLNKNN